MPYTDMFSTYASAMPKGYADNSSTFGEVASTGFEARVAELPFFRDTSNKTHIINRNTLLKNNGIDVEDLASNAVPKPEVKTGLSLARIGVPDIAEDYNRKIEDESNRIADKSINDARAVDPNSAIAQLKTTDEIRQLTVSTRQAADIEAEKASARAPTALIKYGGMLVGGMGAMTDPVNAITLPIGASVATGILRGALLDGVINMGVEAFQTPENMKWAREAGVQYGLGEAAINIATAGIGAGVISGLTRGAGRLLTKGKSMEVLDKLGHDKNIPSEVADAAKYQATVAHIDDNVPTLRDVVTDEEIAINRKNLQEVQDALIEGRAPRIDESIFPNSAKNIERDIADIKAEIQRLESERDILPSILLPRELAGAKPRYGYKDKQFTLQFESDIDRAAYITAQTKKSSRDADYRKFLHEAGLSDDEINNLGSQIRNSIKAIAKDAPAGKINVPKVTQEVSETVRVDELKVKKAERDTKIETLKANLASRESALAQAKTEAPAHPRGQATPSLQKEGGAVTRPQGEAVLHTDRLDPELPDKKTNPLEYIEKRVAKITDKATNDIALADLDAKIKDMPDMKIYMQDGSIKTLKELNDEVLSEDADIIKSLTTCGLGK